MLMGEPREEFDELQFRRKITDVVGRQQDATVARMQVGKVVLEVNQISAETGMRVPSELTMLGKTLLNLDIVGRTLDPDFDPNEAIRRNASDLMQKRIQRDLSPNNLLSALIEAKELIEHLPARLNRFFDLVSNNKLRMKVDTIDETALIAGMQKIANRITLGLILAALIIGAALLMRVETTFRLFGYPGFAIAFFLAASFGAALLVYQIVFKDRPEKK